MTENVHTSSDSGVQMAMAAFYLCLEHAFGHIVRNEGASSAAAFKQELVNELKNGNIDMSILEDAATFDFVVSRIESLTAVEN